MCKTTTVYHHRENSNVRNRAQVGRFARFKIVAYRLVETDTSASSQVVNRHLMAHRTRGYSGAVLCY